MGKLRLLSGESIIELEVMWRQRKTLEIRVEPGGKVLVFAPVRITEDVLQEHLKTKLPWITRKLRETAHIKPVPPKQFVSGEKFLFLGDEYTLQLSESFHSNEARVDLTTNALKVCAVGLDPSDVEQLLVAWYRRKAKEIIEQRVAYYKQYLSCSVKQIKITNPKKRWGSCSSQGRLLFNWRCVMAPLKVLDYVVVHEMCHLLEFNHSPSYWQLVSNIIPDYQEQKEWLRLNGERLRL